MIIPGTNIDVEPLAAIPESVGIPPELKGKPADALRVPAGYLGITNPRVFNRAFFVRFGPVVRKAENGGVYIRESQGGKHFVSASHTDTILNDKNHATRAGLDRYNWFVNPDDGVEYGFLIES